MFSRCRVTMPIIFLFLLVLTTGAVAQTEPFAGLDEYVGKAMKEWETPGLALAIVRNDSVILMKGYGVKKMGGNDPVNAQTIFAIASTTKAMTVACLGMLVDSGKVDWDDPVTKYLPWFQLHDPYVTRELTVRDLLCHRSGLERGDNLWYLSPYSREDVLRRVRFLKPAWSFRSRYGYQNIMFVAAGQIIPSVTGTSWDDFIAQRLFAPLGMTRTRTSLKALETMDNVAMPHSRVDELMQPIRWSSYDNIGPAGSVLSCVQDMAQWVRFNLNRGVFSGKRILSEAVIKEIQTPQVVLRMDSLEQAMRPSNHFATYGLGWYLRDYLGHKIVQHDGAYDGMQARVVLVPEERLGLVLLMNAEHTDLPEAIAYRVLDHFLGGAMRDWSGELLAIAKKTRQKNNAEEKKNSDERVRDTKPSLPLEGYAGAYENETYGPVQISLQQGGLEVKFYPAYVGKLEHWQYDTFRVIWDYHYLGKDLFTFVLNPDGKVAELRWQGFTVFTKSK